MKITKKEFVKAMTENTSIFVGITRKIATKDELELCLENYFKFINDGNLVEKRSAVARSKDLIFSGGSRLDLKGRFEKHTFDKGTFYLCHQEYNSEYDGKTEKNMYYLVTAA